jgi:uncharacterized membrane protein YeaQ/YmgE (transglycosylase-associated protein family)
MHLISWIILGLIAGFIAHKIVGESGQGFFMNTGLGVVGAVVGGELMSTLGRHSVNGLNLYSLIVAVGGSVLVLVVVHAVRSSRRGL